MYRTQLPEKMPSRSKRVRARERLRTIIYRNRIYCPRWFKDAISGKTTEISDRSRTDNNDIHGQSKQHDTANKFDGPSK